MAAYAKTPSRRRYQRTTGQDHKAAGLEARRALVGAIRAARCCRQCGEADPACLDFHHRDPSHKIFSVAFLVAQGYSLERIMAEIEKCDLLCANCHRKLEAGQRAQRKATRT
jgi:hypothetical protein